MCKLQNCPHDAHMIILVFLVHIHMHNMLCVLYKHVYHNFVYIFVNTHIVALGLIDCLLSYVFYCIAI